MRSIGQLFGKVARRALAGHGGVVLPELLRVWPDLFPDLREIARPLKVERRGKAPGALKLLVCPARGLEVQMRERQIISRVNAHFGHEVVARLRLVQAPFAREERGAAALQPDEHVLRPLLAGLEGGGHSPSLRASLERLARGIALDAAAPGRGKVGMDTEMNANDQRKA